MIATRREAERETHQCCRSCFSSRGLEEESSGGLSGHEIVDAFVVRLRSFQSAEVYEGVISFSSSVTRKQREGKYLTAERSEGGFSEKITSGEIEVRLS
jgi:hypothetical protein